MTNYTPTGGNVPGVDNPCAMLSALRAAWYQLMAGQARATVRNGDMWLEFQRGDAKTMLSEIRRLELLCGGPALPQSAFRPRAVRVGNY